MRKFFSRKPLAVLLTAVLVLSFNATALAAWPSFQDTNSNNLYITQP